MFFSMRGIYMSNIYYGFGHISMGKEYDFCMSHYRARYKSEEISPSAALDGEEENITYNPQHWRQVEAISTVISSVYFKI